MAKEKEIDYFSIEWVRYRYFDENERMHAKQIRKRLKLFRKLNRPSYMFINALLEIQSLQNWQEQLINEINRLEKDDKNEKRMIVFYWVCLIIWLFVFGVWFWRICCFLFDLFI